MTGDEALAMLVDAAAEIAAWYRQGGDPTTDRYLWIHDELAIAVDAYRQHQAAAAYQEKTPKA